MNMISTGAFQTEMDVPTKQTALLEKLVSAWEKKNSKVARAGGVSLMALSLAACGDDDTTPFSQADIDTAVAAVDITTDNAAAVTAALTDANGTAHASVDAAVTAGAASVDITSDNAAVVAAAEAVKDTAIAALQATYDALKVSYDALVAPVASALTTTAGDVLSGSAGDDTFTAASSTDDATDIIIDSTTTDADILNYSLTGNSVAITVTNVETVNVTSSVAAATGVSVDASEFSGVTNLNLTRADLANGAIDGSGTVTVTGVNGANVAAVSAVSGVDALTVTQATAAGTVVNATGVAGQVNVDGAATITADQTTVGVDVDGIGVAVQDALPVTVSAALSADVDLANTLTGVINITAPVATTVDVLTASGGVTISAATAPTAASTIQVGTIDASGGTITTGTFASSGTTGAINIEGTSGTSDTITILGGGAIALNTNSDGTGTDQVENLVLGGNGTSVTYTINAGDTVESITTTGSQTVNLAMDPDDATTETITGIGNLDFNGVGAAAIDLTNASASVFDLGADIGQTITVAGTGETVKLDVDQTGLTLLTNTTGSTITLQAGDDTTGSAQSTIALANVDMNDTKDFAVVNLEANTARVTAGNMDLAAATLNISGDENVTFTGTVTSGDIDANSHTGILTMTSTVAQTITTGSAADAMTLNGAANIQTLNTGAGNDAITVTQTGNGSVINAGSGNDTINLDRTDSIAVEGGEGNDSYDISAVQDVAITDTSGTDNLTFDTAAAYDLSAAANFSFTGIETVDITAANNIVTMDDADLSGKTFTLTGDAAADILLAVGGNTLGETIDLSGITVSGTATIRIEGGDKADTMTGAAADATVFVIDDGDVDAGEVITGGTGTDTIAGNIAGSTLGSAVDLSVATITGVESFHTNGVAATIGQGTGIVDVDGYADGTADTFTLKQGTTAMEAAAEASAAAVDIAGEWFFAAETAGAGNGSKLTFFDQVLGEAQTIEFDGTEAGTNDDSAAMVAGSIVVTIA